VKTIGSGRSKNEIESLLNLGRQEIDHLSKQPKLFISDKDTFIEQAFSGLNNSSIRTVGPELILVRFIIISDLINLVRIYFDILL